jgi:hypothetical protein
MQGLNASFSKYPMPDYLYAHAPEPFPHQIRCVPDDVEHDEGVAWLYDIQATVAMLDLEKDVDYIMPSVTIVRFVRHHDAERFYNAMVLGLGANCTLREFL